MSDNTLAGAYILDYGGCFNKSNLVIFKLSCASKSFLEGPFSNDRG